MTIRYFDSGIDGQDACLGRWLDNELVEGIRSFQGQFGFFDFSALRKYIPTLQRMVDDGGKFRLVIGANNGDPASISDVNSLLPLIMGGGDSKLALVSFSDALFHPKTLHLVRANGSAVGVVGSANLTSKGLGHNVEAGVVIDTSDANLAAIARIATAIDYWFDCDDTGVHEIIGNDDVTRLEELGLIVSPSTRRRLRSTQRTRGAVSGRGTRRVGWRPPRTPVDEDLPEVEGEGPVEAEYGADVEKAAIAARWCKRLPRSDAQQVQPGTNPTGKLRLARARFDINHTTYFREEFFGESDWIDVVRQGTTYEEVHVQFNVERPERDTSSVTLRIDHAPHRVADQNNVPTVLGWGPEIGRWLRDHDQTGNWVILEKDLNGQYWLSFQANQPDWAP